MQGYRIHMEDSHTHILSLPDDPGTSFFAVYDGHGGANIGKYASKHLHKFITKRPEYPTDVAVAMKKVYPRFTFLNINSIKNIYKKKALYHMLCMINAGSCVIYWKYLSLLFVPLHQLLFQIIVCVFFCWFVRRHFSILMKHCWTLKNWNMKWVVRRLWSH